jgi:hypothetical protein
MTTVAATQSTAGRQLSQRLMIVCPHTGQPADTGHELTEIGRLAPQRQLLVDCFECGEDHAWTIEDAFLQ